MTSRNTMDLNTQDKENNGSINRKIKNSRRDSFGRGILKNLNKTDDNNTVAVMQIPLRDSQYTAALIQGKSSYKRRVSFAPEVTLHKIEMVPQVSGPQLRQPKRRETIAFAPSSSQGSYGSDSLLSEPSLAKEKPFEAEDLMYDSSDIEMEDDSHVYSSPNRINGEPQFAIHSDNLDEESINMSITQGYPESEDNTMDLTKPLGNIQQIIQQGSNNANNIFSSSIQEQPHAQPHSPRPFGSITSIFGSEHAEEEDNEQAMELTQPFRRVEILNSGEIDKTEINNDQENNDDAEDITVDTTMELTKIADGSTDLITMHNTKANRVIDSNVNEEELSNDANDDANEYDQTEVSMDVTKLESIHSPAPKVQIHGKQSSVKESRAAITPSKSLRQHTSETGSPMSSKRKYKSDDLAALSLRERINSLTPRKKRRSSTGRRISAPSNTTDVFFPITSTQPSSQEEPKSSFIPLRSSKKINRKSVIGSDVVEFQFQPAEKAPLASFHEEENEDKENEDIQKFKPVPLKQFLTDLSIEFFDNLKINDELTLTFSAQYDPSTVSDIGCLVAKASKVPSLELYIFSCTELQKNMAELKKMFDNLNDEFYEENPPLVRDYYQCSSLFHQKKMSDHLLFMKTLSDKEAEKSWLTWRNKLLDELINRLTLNHESLQKENDILTTTFDDIAKLEETIDNEFLTVSNLLEEFSRQNELMEASTNEELMSVRGELFEVLQTSISQKQAVDELDLELQKCSEKIITFDEHEIEILQKRSFIDMNGRDPHSRLRDLQRSFTTIQSVSGIQFKKLDGQSLKVTLSGGLLEALIDLAKFNESELTAISLSEKLPLLTQVYTQKFIQKHKFQNVTEKLNKITNIVNYLNWLDKEIYYLGLTCPIEVQMDDSLSINIKEINKNQGYKAFIEIIFAEDALFEGLTPTSITAKVIYGPQELSGNLLLYNWKSKAMKDSWIQNFETLTLLR